MRFIRYAEKFVGAQRPKLFIEPFAGGATVGLTLLYRDLIDRLLLVELDLRVATFWKRAITDPSFADEVAAFRVYASECREACIADTSSRESGDVGSGEEPLQLRGILTGGLMREVAVQVESGRPGHDPETYLRPAESDHVPIRRCDRGAPAI